MKTTQRIAALGLLAAFLMSCSDTSPTGTAAAAAQTPSTPRGNSAIVERLANLWSLRALTAADNLGKKDLVARILAHQTLSPSLLTGWYVIGSRGTRADSFEFMKHQSAVMNAQMDGKVGIPEQFSLENSLREAALNDAVFSARMDVRLQLAKHNLASAVAPAAISLDIAKILVVAETAWNGAMTPQLATEFVKTEGAYSKRMTEELQRSLNSAEQAYLGGVTESLTGTIAETATSLDQASTEPLRASRQRIRQVIGQVLAGDAALTGDFAARAQLEAKLRTDELVAARQTAANKLNAAVKSRK